MRVAWRPWTTIPTIPVFFVFLVWSQPYHRLGFSIPVCHGIPWYSIPTISYMFPRLGMVRVSEIAAIWPWIFYYASCMDCLCIKDSSTRHVIKVLLVALSGPLTCILSGCCEVTLISKVYQDLPWDRCSAAPTTLTYCICLLSWNFQLNVTN